MNGKMKAAMFVEKNRIVLDYKPIPGHLSDEQVRMFSDIMSTGFRALKVAITP